MTQFRLSAVRCENIEVVDEASANNKVSNFEVNKREGYVSAFKTPECRAKD